MSLRKRPACGDPLDDATATPIAAFPGFYLIDQPCSPTEKPGAPEFSGVDLAVARRTRGKNASSPFAAPLSLIPVSRSRDSDDEWVQACEAWDLHVWIQRKHCYYHRVVGLTMNLVCWGAKGKPLTVPFAPPPDDWGEYVVHHRDWDTTNVSVDNLVPMLDAHHRTLKAKQKLRGPLLRNASLASV